MRTDQIFNPFPGLRSFEEDEDHLFFGREKQIDELLAKLRESRFVAVMGASGSGKSSLVKCGLLPALHSGYMTKAGSAWKVAVFRPGDDPLGNLSQVLSGPGVIDKVPDMEDTYAPIIEATLRRSNHGLIDIATQLPHNPMDNILIVVDQFEELFRFNQHEKNKHAGRRDSVAFVDLLLEACRQDVVPVYIVITMRADFIGECTVFHGLAEAINTSQYLVPRMSRDECREAIAGPVAVGGAAITTRLLTQLLNDVGESSDQLPILQHALLRTWSYWEEHHTDQQPLDLEHYNAIGMMEHALSMHAEEAFHELGSEHNKMLCGVIFKALTERGDGRQGTRRPTQLGEICQISNASLQEVTDVITRFRKNGRSFLMPPSDVQLSETSIIDISHESLMRIWDRLIRWVEEEAQSAEIYRRLAEAAALYHEGRSGLWRNPELQLALKWYNGSMPNRHWAQRYDPSFERAIGFLKESKRQEEFQSLQKERDSRLKIKRARFFVFVLGVAAFIFMLLLVVVMNLQTRAQANAVLAEKRAVQAREQKTIAEAETREAGRQRMKAEQQRREAEVQRREAEVQKKEAERQSMLAYIHANDADVQEKIALAARDEAEQQKLEALSLKNKAQFLQERAEISEKRTNRLHMLSLSATLAFQSVREYRNNNRELGALLAMQAYRFTVSNDGEEMNPDIYAALAQVTENNLAFTGHDDAVRAVAISHDGKTVASGADDKTVRVWNVGQPLASPRILQCSGFPIRCMAYSNGSEKLVIGDTGGNIVIWDFTGTKPSAPVVIRVFDDVVNTLVVDDASHSLIAGGNDGRILSLPLNDLTAEPRIIDVLPGKVTDLALSGGGALLAATCGQEFVRVYTLLRESDSPVTMYIRYSQLLSVTFSHDGRFIAAGARSGNTYLWHTSSPDSLALVLSGHTSGVTDVAFSPDDSVLATAGLDKTVRLWKYTQPDIEPIVLTGHSGWVWSLAFTHDGRRLISASEDKTLRSWAPSVSLLMEQACSKITRQLSKHEWNTYIGNNVAYEPPCK